MAVTTYTEMLTPAQAETLRNLLQDRGFAFKEKPYTLYAASKDKLQISVYEKGPKVLVQGKGTEDFVRFTLEPEIFQEIRLGYEEERFPEMFQPHFGIDESGKGDFFGPLVIAGAYVDAKLTRALLDAGVCDSKRISSDTKIRELAKIVRDLPGIAIEVILVGPKRYNELYEKIGNLNRLLAWGHAAVIERLLRRRPDCPRALSDQFARPALLEGIVKKKELAINLEQRTKAESDPAVAAASIVARERFIDWLDDQRAHIGAPLPRGAGREVQTLVSRIRREQGEETLAKLGKTHFKLSIPDKSE